MTRHVRALLLTAPLLVLAASGCDQPKGEATPDDRSVGAADPESGQGRAERAGQELIGRRAPAVIMRTIDGKQFDLSDYYGQKPVYLKFWATWCIPCRQQMPGFEADYEKYGDRILTVAVNTGFNDDLRAVSDYRRMHGLKMPIVIDDGSLGAALNLRVTPQHVVIGRDGHILYVGHLADERLHAALERALEEPRAAQAPTATTKSQVSPRRIDVAGLPFPEPIADRKPRILLFFSAWCETYLKQSRPDEAALCERNREQVNKLIAKSSAHWLGIASGLWTTEKDLADYRSAKFHYQMPLHLDSRGSTFRAFHVRQVPTMIILDAEGHIIGRFGPKEKDLSTAVSKATKRA
jgi:thiol-disulfide isomerase/thioredoxin